MGILAKDPSSQIGAALAGWDGPRSAEWLILADLYDLQHQSKAKRTPKPYPRPLRESGPSNRLGKTQLPRADAIKMLQSISPLRKPGPLRGPNGRFIKRPA